MKVIILLCLFVVGSSSAYAEKTFERDGIQYHVYSFTVNGVTYDMTYVEGYTGSADTLIIPDYVYWDKTYKVNGLKILTNSSPIQIPTVRTLIFKGPITFYGMEGKPTFECPSLEDVVFKGASPSLPGAFSIYFGQKQGIVAHVGDKTLEEIAAMKEGTNGWSGFADIVSYNEAESETVKVYVTVERGSFTGMTSSETISTGNTTSAVYEHNKHCDYSFTIDPDFSASLYNLEAVYVNGKDITSNLTDINGKKTYTVENVRDEVFIRVVGGRKNCYIAVAVDNGGTVQWDGYTATNNTLIGMFPKATGQEFTITPKEGYEFDRCWLTGWNVAVQYPDYLVSQGDGSYKLTIPSIDMDETTLSVTFKPVGSGSGTSTYDLNGDGTIDVSDIDKLIEEINK